MSTPSIIYNPFTNNFDYAEQGASGGSGGVKEWITVTSTTQAITENTGYIPDNASPVVFTLPSTCKVGSIFRIAGYGLGGWKIEQNANQIIHFGHADTTLGALGYLSSTNRYDSIELLCVVEDLEFSIINGPQGNLSYL